jgi:hypothetical protein
MLTEEQGSVSVTRSLAATVTASATARYSRQFDALRSLRYGDHRYGRLELSTTWQYSELTSFAIQLGYLRQRFDPTFPIVFGSSAYLTASHNFRPHRLK